MKTKKWVTAKKNAYDGDDWGEYDEYDEYGVEEPPQPAAPATQRYYASGQDRSFTDPSQQAPLGRARRNSFEAGEEHRAFSASVPHPQDQQQQQQQQQPPPPLATQQHSGDTTHTMGHDLQDRRDFSPSALPPPLHTRVSPMPADPHAAPPAAQFPPRKSSIGQADAPVATSPRSPGASGDKPLPFIRPADIYRRVEEERERERASMDSSRPSMDSLSRPKDELQSPTADTTKSLQPLQTVPERKSEYLPDLNNESSKGPVGNSSVVSPTGDQGFRSVVDKAFTRTDDQRSVPPTPISKDSDTDMSRSNTNSTSGISPIMSRVPSSATSALKRNQVGGEGSTPVIVEEPHEPAVSVPQPTSTAAASKPVAEHSRNLSNTSVPRSGLATPTRGDSPARSPVVSPQRDFPEPKAAELNPGSPDKAEPMAGGLSRPSSAYATREADIASAIKGNAGSAAPELSAAEKHSQDEFLESHNAQTSIDDALPRSRSASPSKGRVQALAGKFGEVSSRRGSTQSNASRNSVQSWERSHDNSRAPSPTKASSSKPSSPVKEFRPHLPGQWESYATTVATPGEKETTIGSDNAPGTSAQGATELTPTTAQRSAAGDESSVPVVAALKGTGAFMAPKAQEENATQSHNDAYMPRPLQLDRTTSSISSIPPTPPAKNSPTKEHPPQLPAKDVSMTAPLKIQNKCPNFLPQFSTASPVEDQESDRLRKEIVASLNPVKSGETEQRHLSLQPGGPEANRASSILPAEYDSYWADDGINTPPPLQNKQRNASPGPSNVAEPVTPASAKPPAALLHRFSWEANTPHLMTPEHVNTSSPVPEPTKQPVEEKIPSPVVERPVDEERHQWSESLPETYFGPGHITAATKPDQATEPNPMSASPISPVNLESLATPTREETRSPGLHVVNSAVNPEAVDLPPRLGADLVSPARSSQDEAGSTQKESDKNVPNPAISAAVFTPEPSHAAPSQAPATPSNVPAATSPTTDKPLGAREIATINSTAERISTYNKTRDHWATQDHGLESWLVSTLEVNPDLATQISSVQRPSTGTVRHKHTASMSLLGKLGGSNVHHSPTSDQHNTSSAQAPVSGGSPTAPTHSGSGFDRRVASAQMQMKGKDLLHTAGALSGKGLTSAKGLFAKGKSRFGREKVDKS